MFTKFLRSFGLEVAEARSGNEGLAMFKADPPALLVSDIAMPDGHLAHLVHPCAERRGGRPDAGDCRLCAQRRGGAILAGFNVLLSKPVDPVNLVDVMRNFVEHGTRPGRAAWTVHSPRAGLVVIRYTGRLTARDSEAAIEVLGGQRVAWAFRKRVKSLTLVGGNPLARIVSVAAAKLMRIPCIVTAEPPEGLGGAQA